MPLESAPVGARVSNAIQATTTYLAQFFCPVGLAAFYPYPENGLPAWKIAAAAAVLLAVTAAAVAWRRWMPYLFVGWFWYLGMLVPVIGLVQIGEQAMADRYTYLPQIGLGIAIVWGVARLVSRRPTLRCACGVVAALALAALMVCAWRQTSYWRDGETLWRHVLTCTTNNARAENSLGAELGRLKRTDEAVAHCRRALEIAPDYAKAHYNLGLALIGSKQYAEAAACFEESLKRDPNDANACNNLAWLRATCSEASVRNAAEAVALARRAVELSGGLEPAHLDTLAEAYAASGQPAEALKVAEQAVRLAVQQGNATLAAAVRTKIAAYRASAGRN